MDDMRDSLFESDNYHFHIRTTVGQYLRKFMDAQRLRQLLDADYLNRSDAASLRIEAVNKTNGCTQTWDIWQTKYYGGTG